MSVLRRVGVGAFCLVALLAILWRRVWFPDDWRYSFIDTTHWGDVATFVAAAVVTLGCLGSGLFLVLRPLFQRRLPSLRELAAGLGLIVAPVSLVGVGLVALLFSPAWLGLILVVPAATVLVGRRSRRTRASIVGLVVAEVVGSISLAFLLAPNFIKFQGRSKEYGLSPGGAHDVGNFRRAIAERRMPRLADLTVEGLFAEYYFDTGSQAPCGELLCPTLTTAVSSDPQTHEAARYVAVGLDTNLERSTFHRKHLNLVIALDISGSMRMPFHDWSLATAEEPSKIAVARDSLKKLVSHLGPQDSLGVVLFNDQVFEARPLEALAPEQHEPLVRHIEALEAGGGTDLERGLDAAVREFGGLDSSDPDETENRVIVLTDLNLTVGDVTGDHLVNAVREMATRRIYTSVVGIGLDFNSELVGQLNSIAGTNSFSVGSAKAFGRLLDEQFEEMVTPVAFDVELRLVSADDETAEVYGSPTATPATGTVFKVPTLFPARAEEGEVRGGIILLKLRSTEQAGPVRLELTYRDRAGRRMTAQSAADWSSTPETMPPPGVRKAILLARYATLVREWLCQAPDRVGARLASSPDWAHRLSDFADYIDSEATGIGDPTLKNESQILRRIAAPAPVGLLNPDGLRIAHGCAEG